jgi:uncharacterized membrane protein YeaQ/YmgE (transglycosylase-associated protein family)
LPGQVWVHAALTLPQDVQSSVFPATSVHNGVTLRVERRTTMSIIAWIVIGALAGWLASKMLGRDNEMGWMSNILVGILGAIVGGLIMALVGGDGVSGFNLYSVLVAIGGALLLLFAYNALKGGSRRTTA